MIILINVFGPQLACRLFFLKMSDSLEYIKPFLLLLKILPAVVIGVGGRDWNTDEIAMDEKLVRILRTI